MLPAIGYYPETPYEMVATWWVNCIIEYTLTVAGLNLCGFHGSVTIHEGFIPRNLTQGLRSAQGWAITCGPTVEHANLTCTQSHTFSLFTSLY